MITGGGRYFEETCRASCKQKTLKINFNFIDEQTGMVYLANCLCDGMLYGLPVEPIEPA